MQVRYRVGMPGWRFAARLGAQMQVRVNVHHDPECNRYWADSPDIDGLVVEGGTLDELCSEVVSAASLLLEDQIPRAPRHVTADIHVPSALCAA